MDLLDLATTLIILLFSAILHEIAHGYVADRLGDPTARLLGRLTLDPRKHIDPMMSIALPLILFISSGGQFIFGAAKPVPVDEFNLRDGRKDMALVALAGPLTNVILAITASVLVRFLLLIAQPLGLNDMAFTGTIVLLSLLVKIVHINLLLAFLNLLPLPPLDGSKVFAMLLSEKNARAYLALGSMGMILLFILLMFPLGPFSLTKLLFSLLTFAEGFLLP